MKIKKPEGKSSYLIEYHNKQYWLPLVTSVAFFAAKMFPAHNKWKVKEDSNFLKTLIIAQEKQPTKDGIESLIQMETYYMELNGNFAVGTDKDKAREIKSERAASRKDIMSVGLNSGGLLDNNHTFDLGELVEAKRKADGANRNRNRKKKTP